jgi:folate-binding protein YgfZ
MSNPIAYAPLPSRALIAVGGADWRDFLQGLITQDVETLANGEARFAALLTPQGRLLFDLFVVGRLDGCWLDVAAEHRDALIQRLMMYRLRAKVEIAADETPVAALFGDAGELAEAWIPDPRLTALGWRGYGVARPEDAVAVDEAAYDAHRLGLGVPGPADWGSEKTYPIEANFDLLNGIDFKKGCFVGQETTSRMKRRGQIKSRMLPLAFEGAAPDFGAEVLAGELRAGELLSGQPGRAMALVRLDRIAKAPLTIGGRSATPQPPEWLPAFQEDASQGD